MAQYDLVLLQNQSPSDVSFNEVMLGVPNEAGHALTQNPANGALAWKPAMLLVATLPTNTNLNTVTTSGWYDLPALSSYDNIPEVPPPAVLQVFDIKSMVVQLLYAAYPDQSGHFIFFRNKVGNYWRGWQPIAQSANPPAELLDENDVVNLINNSNKQIIAENPVVDTFDLLPIHKNHLILLYAELDPRNPPPYFNVNIHHQNQFTPGEGYEIGSVYELCLMSDTETQLNFIVDETVISGGEQLVHGRYDLIKYTSARLTCIKNNEWLVEYTR
ncbi:MAG: hypothetical protein IPM52_13165 [Bacteroidetes bacterium]|nr:hypothetical protein [Bacteroidota bacterium]